MDARDPHCSLPLSPITYHVLLALVDKDRHGYGIIKEVEEQTEGRFDLEAATLYAALRRLKEEGLIEMVPRSERPAEEDRRRRTYRLTPHGKRVLAAESERLAHLLELATRKSVLQAKPAR